MRGQRLPLAVRWRHAPLQYTLISDPDEYLCVRVDAAGSVGAPAPIERGKVGCERVATLSRASQARRRTHWWLLRCASIGLCLHDRSNHVTGEFCACCAAIGMRVWSRSSVQRERVWANHVREKLYFCRGFGLRLPKQSPAACGIRFFARIRNEINSFGPLEGLRRRRVRTGDPTVTPSPLQIPLFLG